MVRQRHEMPTEQFVAELTLPSSTTLNITQPKYCTVRKEVYGTLYGN
jgi:hypothetical protein